jgi:hypothetical protein
MDHLDTIRSRCRELLDQIGLPSPFDLTAFCQSVAARRGRPVHLISIASGLGPCGLWAASDEADYIFYEQETSSLHQQHIILHELGHLLFGHAAPKLSLNELAKLLLPNLQRDMVHQVLARAGYSTEEEQEAELFATLVQQRATSRSNPLTNPDTENSVVRQIEIFLAGAP